MRPATVVRLAASVVLGATAARAGTTSRRQPAAAGNRLAALLQVTE